MILNSNAAVEEAFGDVDMLAIEDLISVCFPIKVFCKKNLGIGDHWTEFRQGSEVFGCLPACLSWWWYEKSRPSAQFQ